ncbi:hypothetical protein Pve01_84040 [Planomonospora venezuelensis]|nr:hypothetical protein Pve01_84040 [Planomonospora venezuelensis]
MVRDYSPKPCRLHAWAVVSWAGDDRIVDNREFEDQFMGGAGATTPRRSAAAGRRPDGGGIGRCQRTSAYQVSWML